MIERIPLEAALSRLSGSLGVDFSQMELDQPLEEQQTQASQGLMKAMSASFENRRFTLREAAIRWGLAVGMPQLVGTPEQVADQIETIWRETGCHGFNVTPTITPVERRGIRRRGRPDPAEARHLPHRLCGRDVPRQSAELNNTTRAARPARQTGGIDNPIICTRIPLPDPALVAEAANYALADLHKSLGAVQGRMALMSSRMRPLLRAGASAVRPSPATTFRATT